MSIIYVGCVAVIILTVLGFLGAAEDIAHQMREPPNGKRLR
jgi:hypothetical protein